MEALCPRISTDFPEADSKIPVRRKMDSEDREAWAAPPHPDPQAALEKEEGTYAGRHHILKP